MDSSPSVSFIGIVDFTEDAKWLYCSESVHDLLGFEPHELIGRPSLDLVHPDEFPQVRAIHYSTITQDQAAVLAYLRMRHKDPCKGYILCAISRTVCQNVLVGSVSFASPGPKAMHNASTAQEVTIITPTAKDFEFRRWGDPNPMPPCPVPPELMPTGFRGPSSSVPSNAAPMRFDPLPEQSVRTALILNRFSVNCDVMYCANDSILATTTVLGRPFFDFVAKRDEELVRSWIDVVKSWGVNERGQPSDGGFGFGKFTLLVHGRDSRERDVEVHTNTRHRQSGHRNYSNHPPVPPPPKYTDHASRDNVRDQTGRDYIRELTRERPDSRHISPSSSTSSGRAEELVVDAIFSAHSDGLMVIIRQTATGTPSPATSPYLTLASRRPSSSRSGGSNSYLSSSRPGSSHPYGNQPGGSSWK